MVNYEELDEIIVKSQKELDMITDDFKGRIYIEFGTYHNPAVVRKRYGRVIAQGNAYVVAQGNAYVVARDNASVVARENASVEAWENSHVEAQGNAYVVARENASVEAWENSHVEAQGNAYVVARENASVVARDNASVVARENASVVARDNASVVARENASVEAWENSHVEAQGNAYVVARENASVVARENASVEAWENVQVCNCLNGGKIEITDNARIVCYPKTIDEYCSFYGIERTKNKGRFYKCVHRRDDIYFSEYSHSFKYKLSEIVSADSFDDDINEDCGHGIHIAHLNWVLDFGKNWNDLAILEVEAELDKIVIPKCSNGKIRVPEVKVIREVPLEECGIYGKILAKRLRNREG